MQLEEDCENWHEFRLQNKALKLKRNILPFKYLRCAKIEKQEKLLQLNPIERLQHECILSIYRKQILTNQLQTAVSLNLFPQKLSSSTSCNSLTISSTTSISSTFKEPRLTYCNQTINLAKINLQKQQNLPDDAELPRYLSENCLKKNQSDPQLRRCKSDSSIRLNKMPKSNKFICNQSKRPKEKSKLGYPRKLHFSEYKIELEIENNCNWSTIANAGEANGIRTKIQKRLHRRRLLKIKCDGDKNHPNTFKKP